MSYYHVLGVMWHPQELVTLVEGGKCYTHLMGQYEGCWWTSNHAQDNTTRHHPQHCLPDIVVLRLGNPGFNSHSTTCILFLFLRFLPLHWDWLPHCIARYKAKTEWRFKTPSQ